MKLNQRPPGLKEHGNTMLPDHKSKLICNKLTNQRDLLLHLVPSYKAFPIEESLQLVQY